MIYTNKIGNKEELCKKNRRAIKKVPKYLELSMNTVYLLKNLVRRFSPLYYIVRTQTKIADVVTNKLIMSTSKSCAYSCQGTVP